MIYVINYDICNQRWIIWRVTKDPGVTVVNNKFLCELLGECFFFPRSPEMCCSDLLLTVTPNTLAVREHRCLTFGGSEETERTVSAASVRGELGGEMDVQI